jgi:AmmeMemoRadiSam system protein A
MIDIAVLMCHAPIVIPAIAGPRAKQCSQTTAAMREAARRVVDSAPDVLVVISPHAPRNGAHWGIDGSAVIEGSFANFGVPDVGLRLPGAPDAARGLAQTARGNLLPVYTLPAAPLDHGALVPLYFMVEAGWRGATLLVALPMPGAQSEERFGQAVRDAAAACGQRWAVLASGDMSHRLQRGAPAGYHPDAFRFDAAFVEALRQLDYRAACSPDPQLQELAAEDVVASTCVAYGATAGCNYGAEFLSYEGPFGVGYCEAVLSDTSTPPRELLDVARDAIRGRTNATHRDVDPVWREPRAVFVTLRSPDGQLRGCIGQLAPTEPDLVREVERAAIAAATRDPRFPPVSDDEIDDLRIEVSVLERPVPIASPSQLDPHRYGVVVHSGPRRGVLLPNVEGVDTIELQLRIACEKAGIAPGEHFDMERFLVRKVAQA